MYAQANFFVLEKLSGQVPEIKLFIKHLLGYVQAKFPGKVKNIMDTNFPGVQTGFDMGSEPTPAGLEEFNKAFSESPHLRQIIVEEYFYVLKPLLARLGTIDDDAVNED